MSHPQIERLRLATNAIIDTLTHVDYIGIIEFNDEAATYHDLTTLAPSLPGFRERLKRFVSGLEIGGETNFQAAFER